VGFGSRVDHDLDPLRNAAEQFKLGVLQTDGDQYAERFDWIGHPGGILLDYGGTPNF
jgi:hypothetical protein